MSQRSEREGSVDFDTDLSLERLRELYHIPVLALLLAFMLWNRARTWDNFVVDGEVLLSGNDPWYHLRQTSYTVQNWPFTMPYDPWTFFPVGTSPGQFGTLFDQILATAALVVGLGSPTEETIAMTLLFAPAVFGTLAAIPAYFIGKRLVGRAGGIVAVLILALNAGTFLSRGLAGAADHNIAEVFFQATALVAVMAAFAAARQDRPVWELVTGREWDALRRPVAYAAAAGVAIAAYLYVWPPGVLMIGLLAIFCLIQLSLEFVRGESPESTAFVAAVAFGVTFVLMALHVETTALTVTDYSLLQPIFALLSMAGVVLMAYVAREWEARGIDRRFYPLSFLAVGGLGLGVLAIAAPDLFGFFVDQITRVFGLSASAEVSTVGEAQPLSFNPNAGRLYFVDFLQRSYGLLFYSAILAGALILVRYALSEETNAEPLLILFWFVTMTLATFTQNRFDYYLVIPVAALNAYLVAYILSFVDLDDLDQLTDISGYQVVTILVVLMLIVGPFISFVGLSSGGSALQTTAASERNGPGEDITGWSSSLEYLSENTPSPETDEFAYYGTFERQTDYEYASEQYGVMSWWDYGHYITTQGQRIPYANPFQQNARDAAGFLLSRNESEANSYMTSEDGEETRYVMIDWKLAEPHLRVQSGFITSVSGKYSAPAAFYQGSADVASQRALVVQSSGGSIQGVATTTSQAHFESMRYRLYEHHGSAIPLQVSGQGVPVVIYEPITLQGGQEYRTANPSVVYNATVEEARSFASGNPNAEVGGLVFAPGVALGGRTDIPRERVPALEHYRLVHASENNWAGSESWVKTFEKVEGATIEGTGPADQTVTISVQMRMTNKGQNFTYTQQVRTDDEGEFTATVPYSTTGYDEFGPENGHTNLSVRATGGYSLTTVERNETATTLWAGQANVTEAQVLGEDGSPVTVDMEAAFQQAATQNETDSSSDGSNALEPVVGATVESTDTATDGPLALARAGPLSARSATAR